MRLNRSSLNDGATKITVQNSQTLNITTQNYTLQNHDTSFANEQSYCIPRANQNSLNNFTYIEEFNNTYEQSIQPSIQPSVLHSINPTQRKFIFCGNQDSKTKYPSANRLLNWNNEYIKMQQNQQENNRFYFIKILNPFPSNVLQLDQDQNNGNSKEKNEENQNQRADKRFNNISHTETNNMTIDDEIKEKQFSKYSNNEESKTHVDTLQNYIETNKKNYKKDVNILLTQKRDKQKEITIPNSDNEEEEKKEENVDKSEQEDQKQKYYKKFNVDPEDKNSVEDQSFNKRGQQVKNQQRGQQNNIFSKQQINQNILSKKESPQNNILQQQNQSSNIFQNNIFQRYQADSNTNRFDAERNKSQQKEIRELLKEFLSYSELIPIDLQTTSKWKVSRLKRFLFSTELSSCKYAKLLYQGKELRDIDMIYDYKIIPGHVIQAVLQKEEILNQFQTNSERKRNGNNLQQQADSQQNIQSMRNQRIQLNSIQDNHIRNSERNNQSNRQQIRPSQQIQQQLMRDHHQRNIFNYMNQQGFDRLKEQYNISDRDIILQRIYFHSKAQISRDNYQNLSDLVLREEKWLNVNFRKVDSYQKFRNYDFKNEQNFPYNQQFLRNLSNNQQDQSSINFDSEHQKQKLSTRFIQFACGVLLGYILGLFLFLLLFFKIEVCTISRTFIYSVLAGILAKSFYQTFQFVFYDEISLFV